MQLHDLQRKTPHTKGKRVGRGNASGKGKTSGRGTKGQKARAGHKIWPNIREILKKLPKRRGYNQKSIKPEVTVINLGTLEKFFTAGDVINAKTLTERKLVKKGAIKILGDGELTKKLTVSGVKVSGSAREKIEKAGGTIN